jgi:hypothetical protein
MPKPDLYLKAVLTAIAIGLFWVGFTLNTRTVSAEGGNRVVITGIDIPNAGGVVPVGILATGWESYQGGGGSWKHSPFPVTINNLKPVPVSVVAKEESAEKPK